MICRSIRCASWMIAAATALLVAEPAAGRDFPSQADLALLNRVTWGQTENSAKDIARLGSRRWLREQLFNRQVDALPAAAQEQIDQLPLVGTPVTELVAEVNAQRRKVDAIKDPDQKQIAESDYQKQMEDLVNQARARSILRNLYSPTQVRERLTWFWMNHFSIQAGKSNIRATIGDYEDQAIRPRALGRFRDLLEATLKHPAMLRYLDNVDNAAGRINENYAREIMELHTMGVGSGYTQKDVEELARILTGLGVAGPADQLNFKSPHAADFRREGMMVFNPDRHDYGDKMFLGHKIRGAGFSEVEEALDILCREPATGRHISRQLATYFLGDNPSDALTTRMANRFKATDGDIAKVLETLFDSAEFRQSLGGKFKDPVQYVFSAIRLTYGDKVIRNPKPIQSWISTMGEGLYNRPTPDGYPVEQSAWTGPGQMATRFDIARQIGSNSAALFKAAPSDPEEVPAFPNLQNALYFQSGREVLSPSTFGPRHFRERLEHPVPVITRVYA